MRKVFRKSHRIRRWKLFSIVGVVCLLLVLVGLSAHFGPRSFAKGLSFETCATLPANASVQQRQQFCNGEDPILQGCSVDALTVISQPIMSNNAQIGVAEVRYSSQCMTYWGRGTTYLPNTKVAVIMTILNGAAGGYSSTTQPQIYSNMNFGIAGSVLVSITVSPTQTVSVTV